MKEIRERLSEAADTAGLAFCIFGVLIAYAVARLFGAVEGIGIEEEVDEWK